MATFVCIEKDCRGLALPNVPHCPEHLTVEERFYVENPPTLTGQRDTIPRPRRTCGYPVSSLPNDNCIAEVVSGSPYCAAHQPKEKVVEKTFDRSPVESDAIHLLKQAVRRLENGDKVNAERYVAGACLLLGIGVTLDQ